MQMAVQADEDMAARLWDDQDTDDTARRLSRDWAASTRADLRVMGQ